MNLLKLIEIVEAADKDFALAQVPAETLEKFARLIAKECAEICKKQEYDYWRSSEDQDFTPQDCADAIEQHFGVK